MRSILVVLSVAGIVGIWGCETSGGGGMGGEKEPPVPPRVNPVGKPAEGAPRSPASAETETATNAKKAREAHKNMTFEEFKATVWREPEAYGGKYIVNGDRALFSEKQLEEFFERSVKKEPSPHLITDTINGTDNVWNASMKDELTYCVSTGFGSNYAAVVEAMDDAANEWEAVADIDFTHADAEDGQCTASNPNVVFDVRPVNVNGNYLARAFFPNEPRAARNVLIDRTAFRTTGRLTLTGILRHELGHTLGFRHEHTRPESGACFEDSNWRPVTDYDALSVMHYPQCNGQGDWSLELTLKDKNGAACVYGPAPGFEIDDTICDPPETPDSPCAPQTKTFSGTVARGEEDHLEPFTVAPGTVFEAVMTGSGDPDLYVRFGQQPSADPTVPGTPYSCRPYLSGASESCTLDVPAGENEAFIMVRGYRAGSYTVTVTFQGSAP